MIKKVKKYYKKADKAVKRKKNQKTDQLKATNKLLKTKTPLLKYKLFPPQLEWNPFWPF